MTANPDRLLIPPWDDELERYTLGTALLGYPLPPELEREDFFAGPHRLVFDAIEACGSGASLPTVNAFMRDVQSAPTRPQAVSSVELYAMMAEADYALRQGWPKYEPERLRELRRRRDLLEAMARARIGLHLDRMSVCQAMEMLRGAAE